jgi:hypothetical protein
MGRFALIAVLTFAVATTFASAQGVVAGWGGVGSMPASAVSSPDGSVAETDGIRASAAIGVQHLNLRFNLPISLIPGTGVAPLDFRVKNANLWVGSARIEGAHDNLGFFLRLEANVPQKITVTTPTEPFFVGAEPVDWVGSRFTWFSVDGGAGYLVGKGISVVGGIRFDRTDLNFGDPKDFAGLFPPVPYTYQGDARVKIWLPFVGLHVEAPHFRANVLASPYAFVDMRLPLRVSATTGPALLYFADLKYSMKKPGGFLEAEAEYIAELASGMNLVLWGKASWIKARGAGNEEFRDQLLVLGIPVLAGALNAGETGAFTRSAYSVGVTAELPLSSPF